MEQIQFVQTSPDELLEKIEQIILNKIKCLNNVSPEKEESILTREETLEYLKVSSTTLWDWTKKGLINSYGIGNRVYYKKSELLRCLEKLNQ